MKKIITAITLVSLLGCEQTPKQKTVDTVVYEPVVKGIVRERKVPYCGEQDFSVNLKKHDHDSGYFHDAQQIPQKFSGTIESWIVKTGEPCPQKDGLLVDVYAFLIKTSEGTKELEVIAYEEPEKKYLKSISKVGTHVTCSYATYLSRSDMIMKRERYRAPFSEFIKTEDLK